MTATAPLGYKSNKTKVVLLNGPKLSGKDSGADYLVNYFHPCNASKREFKKKLYDLVMCIYSVSPDRFWQIYNDRTLKETPLPEFEGLSIRQAMIKVSEEVIKPVYGKEYFGTAAARELVEGGVNIFSDSGFIEELNPLIRKVGKEHVLLLQIRREGYTFAGDSRTYLPLEVVPNAEVVHNNGTLDDYYSKLRSEVKFFLMTTN